MPVEPGVPPTPCDAKSLRCPYHSWTYGLDGRLLHAPHTEDVDLDTSAFGLQRLRAEAWGGFLWLTEDLEAPSVVDALSPVPDRVRRYPLDTLVVGMRLNYSVAANWKVLAENYNECYHCGPVHPELSRLVPAFAGGGTDLAWDDGIPHREGAWTFTLSGTTDRAPFPDLDDAERVRHKGELVYPNLLLSLSAEHVAAFVLRPTAVDRTEITCDLLFAPDEAAKPGIRSQRRRRSLGSGQPAGLGDLRVGAARNDVAVLHAGLVRADGGRLPRHPTLAASPARPTRLPTVTETCDLAVIGLGALGSSTAWHAARRGLRVVGIEAFGFGHDRGASHDTSRIIRHSYHTPAYVASDLRRLRRVVPPRGRDRRAVRDGHRWARPVPARCADPHG